MKKHINILLIGFLMFILGLISLNFEFVKYDFVDYMPSDFEEIVDSYTINIKTDKVYKIARAKYNQNISIKKVVNNNLNDEIYVEVRHLSTSSSTSTIRNTENGTAIVFSNDLKLKVKDLKRIPSLVVDCIKNKKIYNYNLLKYSKITIYGNEEVLKNIEVIKYEK